jgi:predicted secreted Zn-dependent protease
MVASEPMAGLRSGEVHVTATTDYYDVPGTTLAQAVDWLNRLRLEGPSGPPSQGLTRYNILPKWRAVASGGACRLEGLSVQVTLDVTLPRWPGADARPVEERDRWRRIEQAIRAHELGHSDIVIAEADDLAMKLRDVEARGCGRLGDVVEVVLRLADLRLREAHAEFDRATPSRLSIGGPGR